MAPEGGHLSPKGGHLKSNWGQLPQMIENIWNHKVFSMVTHRSQITSASPWQPLGAPGGSPGAQGGATWRPQGDHLESRFGQLPQIVEMIRYSAW